MLGACSGSTGTKKNNVKRNRSGTLFSFERGGNKYTMGFANLSGVVGWLDSWAEPKGRGDHLCRRSMCWTMFTLLS